MEITMPMHLDAAPEEAFDFMADVTNEPAWNPDVKSVRRLDDGPVVVGSEWEGDYKGMGAMRIRLEEIDRPNRLAFSTSGSRMDMQFSFEFGPGSAASGTDVTARADVHPRGAMKLVGPLLGPMMRRTLSQRPAQLSAGLRAARDQKRNATS
jgi:carbon monoxide dehydrogenase subunit G